jgi:hypothetical protein
MYLLMADTDVGYLWNAETNGALVLGTGGAERARITPAGKFGIGTNTPAHQLEVVGPASVTVGVSAGGAGFSELELVGQAGKNYITSDDTLSFDIGGTERATIATTGLNVTSGTLSQGGTAVSLSGHTHSYQPSGTYVSTVSGNDPISSSGTTAISLSHATTDGYHHVPATSTTNNGKFLKSGATAGSETWANIATTDVTTGNYVATLAAGTGVTVTGADANAAAKTVAIGQAVATTSTPTFAGITINGTLTGNKSAHTSINQGLMVTATSTTITTTTQPTTPSTSNTQLISWSGAQKANTGMWSSGGSITLPVAGMYQFVFGSRFGSGTAYGIAVYAFQNTTLRHNVAKDASSVSSLDAIEMTGMIYAAANDTLSIRVAASAASKTLSALTFLGVMYMGDF